MNNNSDNYQALNQQTVNIALVKADAVTSAASLLWKYGHAIEGADNFRQVYNVEASTADGVDMKVLSDSWEARSLEAVDMMKDFVASVSGTEGVSKAVTLYFSNRWKGTQQTLKAALDKWLLDAMMYDWCNATAPGEATVYGNQMVRDGQAVTGIVYSVGRPAIQ